MADGYSAGDWAKGCRMTGWLKRGYPWVDCRIELFGFAFFDSPLRRTKRVYCLGLASKAILK